MTQDDLIARVKAWQDCEYVHPLTCGVNSEHDLLVPTKHGDVVVLDCPTCGYRQYTMPNLPSLDELKAHVEAMKELFAGMEP